jgi:hypothetical protein
MYAIEVEEPHTFLISDSSYDEHTWKPGEPRLFLTHNGIPALGVGLSLAFGSTPASISFAEATLSAGGVGAALGPAGVAVGVITSLGFLGYQLYKNKDEKQSSFYLERSDPSGASGGNDPKDPKDKKSGKSLPPPLNSKQGNENNNAAQTYTPPSPDSSTVVGRKGWDLKGLEGKNKPTTIYGREYSGHAIDRIQQRGVTPMAVENTIKNGAVTPDPIPGRLRHYDSANNLTAITDQKTGTVISVMFGER